MAIQTGPLAGNERTQWETLYRGYAEFYQMPMGQTTLDTVWAWIHDADNPFYALVARDGDNNLLGLMHYRAMPSPLRGKLVGFLDDLFVRPESRGQGVVGKLFVALDQEAQSRGWPYVRWITADNNYRARGHYDKISARTQWVTYQMNAGQTN